MLPLFLGVILVAGVCATSFRLRYLYISAGLTGLWFIATLVGQMAGSTWETLLPHGVFVMFSLFSLVVILGHILKAREVNRDVIFAGISVYFLLAISWALIYFIIENLSPGSLYFAGEETSKFSTLFLYYSLATITTLGYGEIYPVSDAARIFSAMEGVTGFLYIGVFIARLIALFKRV